MNTPIISARARVVDAMRRMEAAHLSAAPQAQRTQVGAMFVQAARLYATQISIAVPGLPAGPADPRASADAWEIPAGCLEPASCSSQGACLFLECPYRTEKP